LVHWVDCIEEFRQFYLNFAVNAADRWRRLRITFRRQLEQQRRDEDFGSEIDFAVSRRQNLTPKEATSPAVLAAQLRRHNSIVHNQKTLLSITELTPTPFMT
jgi:hypothetical protein